MIYGEPLESARHWTVKVVEEMMKACVLVILAAFGRIAGAQVPPEIALQVQELVSKIQWKSVFLKTFTLLGPHHGCMTVCNDQHTRACTHLVAEGLEWQDVDVILNHLTCAVCTVPALNYQMKYAMVIGLQFGGTVDAVFARLRIASVLLGRDAP